MHFSQVKDILRRAVEFHGLLHDFYLTINESSEKESVKLLVDYMARREKIMQNSLKQLSAQQEKQIADEWVKYEPEFASCRCFNEQYISKNSGVDEIIDAGLNLNQCLIDLYNHMTDIAPTQEIKTLFSSLKTSEIAEKKKLARMRGM